MLKTAMIFSDNMVIQQNKKFKIWGTGTAGNSVSGVLKGKTNKVTESKIDKEGNWILEFPEMKAERNLELIIYDGKETLTYKNIAVGEVWLAGGQSNMEYHLEYDAEKENVLNGKMNLDIRFFDYPEVSYEGQLDEHDYSKFGIWRTCTKEDLPYFSAIGYYFAQNINESLDVPIGIVGCNWGGTPACAWLDPDYLKDNEGEVWLDTYKNSVKDINIEKYKEEFKANPANDRSNLFNDKNLNKMMYPGFSREEQLKIMEESSNQENNVIQVGPYHERRPGGLYDVMLKKLVPYSIRGVIWYQGENDCDAPEAYSTVFGKVIECWRDLWKENFPFLFVQLAPYGEWLGFKGTTFPELRKQQDIVSKKIPNAWMASSSDCGMEYDIHPKHKKPIGSRLAFLARKHVYKEDILGDAPEYEKTYRNHNEIKITFKYAEGMYLKGDKVNSLEIYDENNNIIIPSEVFVKDNMLYIKGNFNGKITISFARTPYYEVNLYNKNNNPVKPFEITI